MEMNSQSTQENFEEVMNSELSKAINEFKLDPERILTKLRLHVSIFSGVYQEESLFLVHFYNEQNPQGTTVTLRDILRKADKKSEQLEYKLGNQFGFVENDFKYVQKLVEKKMKARSFESIDEATTRAYLNVSTEVVDMEKKIEKHFNDVIDYIVESPELFPIRDLRKGLDKDEGYVDGISNGVYIADEAGVEKYGAEVIAIAPKVLQTILSISDTTEQSYIIEQFVQKGYMLNDKPQVKLRYRLNAKRMYLIPVSVKEGVLRRD